MGKKNIKELVGVLSREWYNYSIIEQQMPLLGIDDIRKPFDGWAERYAPFHPDEIIWTKNYDEVMTFLEKRGCPDKVCFDHDLGETGENERNRLTCAKAIIDYCMKNNLTYQHTTYCSQIL